MIRFVMVASLLVGCRISLEDNENDPNGRTCQVATSALCVDAEQHSDLAWIEDKVFAQACAFSGCHNGDSSAAGMIDLRQGKSHAHLFNVASKLEPTRMLVVPNDIHASYLMLMLHDFAPSEAKPPGTPPSPGYMPQGNQSLCCQKLDAIERWINLGAPTN